MKKAKQVRQPMRQTIALALIPLQESIRQMKQILDASGDLLTAHCRREEKFEMWMETRLNRFQEELIAKIEVKKKPWWKKS